MNKKNGTLLLAAAMITVLNFHSCKKYDDGPSFTLRSKKGRLTGEWELVKLDGQSMNSGYSIEWEFEKDGDFSWTYDYGTYTDTYSGEWEFSSDKEEIEIEIDGWVENLEIKRLTNKELTLEYDGDEWEFEKK